MSSLISINSDDLKDRRYLVFSNRLIATTGSDDLWAFSDDSKSMTNVVADMCIIGDDISFKRLSVTNFKIYLRQHMSSLISINSDDLKDHRYLVFSNRLIATTVSDDL